MKKVIELMYQEVCCLCGDVVIFHESVEINILDKRGFACWSFCKNCSEGKNDIQLLESLVEINRKFPQQTGNIKREAE